MIEKMLEGVNVRLNTDYFSKKEAENLGHVHFGGRLGQYRYFDMDKMVSEALELTKRLIQLKRNPKI